MSPEEILQQAITDHKPVRIYACFSGGHDSLTTTHFAMNHGAHEVLHINTGIGIEETREFVRVTCQQQVWPLREVFPPAMTYEQFVLKHGFPGPAAHRYAYFWLKERAIRKVIRESKIGKLDRVMLVTGVRQQESSRRMGYVEPVMRMGCTVWVAPMYQWSKMDCNNYIAEHGLQRSPVVDLIHMSGECLCGSFAKPNELKEIGLWFPNAVKQIREIEAKAKEAGKHCIWGTKPKKENATGNLPFMPMCVGCEAAKFEPEGTL